MHKEWWKFIFYNYKISPGSHWTIKTTNLCYALTSLNHSYKNRPPFNKKIQFKV